MDLERRWEIQKMLSMYISVCSREKTNMGEKNVRNYFYTFDLGTWVYIPSVIPFSVFCFVFDFEGKEEEKLIHIKLSWVSKPMDIKCRYSAELKIWICYLEGWI